MIKIAPRLRLASDFIKFYLDSNTIYQIDSPLLYSFCESVLDGYNSVATPLTDQYRIKCLQNDLNITEAVTNKESKVLHSNRKRIKHLSSSASSSPVKYRLLVSLAKWAKAERILELGTNLGFSALALAENGLEVDTIEGNNEIYNYAHANIRHPNLSMYCDLFENYLLKNTSTYDLIFIDGNHRYQATLDLLEQCKRIINPGGIIVIDDIRWSAGMKRAWSNIKSSSDFNLCIDIFMIGIISKKEELHVPLEVKLLPKRYKPWPYYFFR